MKIKGNCWYRLHCSFLSFVAYVVSLAVCLQLPALATEARIDAVIDDAAMADESNGKNWPAFGRTHSERRYSPLNQIDSRNVRNLKADWYRDLPQDRGLVSTPLVVDGTLYFIGSMNRVRAVDATTGELLWEYDPKVAKHSGNGLRAGWDHSRGIGIWKDNVYVATWDGRLNAIERVSGREVWSVRTFAADQPLYITGAPKIFKGKVLIGNGGTESGPSRGYVTAYDAETGRQVWRFYIVPGNPADGFENAAMRKAANTWSGEWWRHGGGGNAWHGFTYDAELDQLYIGTGNGSPWNQRIRSPGGGDNLFLSSIVALDPDSGDYLWHYQTTPGEMWDFNSNMDIVLADLTLDGHEVKALMHAPKNGFFYVIDRTTGELVSAKPFTNTTWATHIDMVTGRPVEVAGARYSGAPALVSPGPFGAHNWHAMSYSPNTGLAYIPTMHMAAMYSDNGIDVDGWRAAKFQEGDAMGVRYMVLEGLEKVGSTLQAWDPVLGETVWEIPLPGHWNAGTLATAGNLVFQGRATGDLVAYDALNGKPMWSYNLGLGISAPPISYSVHGKQYLAILVGWGGVMAGFGTVAEIDHGWAYGVQTRRLVAFSLDGKVRLPALAPATVPEPISIPEFRVDGNLAKQGQAEFARCAYCHGTGAKSAGMAPDLRASIMVASEEAFAEVVRGGTMKAKGMPEFSGLTDNQLLTLRHFIRFQAESALKN